MVDQPESFWRDIMARNRYFYALRGGDYFYALRGGDVVGLAGLATPTCAGVGSADKGAGFTEALPTGAGMLISVFAAAKARGFKLGERLSVAVIEQAKAEGLRELYLDVAEHNTVAREIYNRLGFALTGERRQIGNAELEMRLDLEQGEASR